MKDDDIQYIINWLNNYITLYVINGEEEAYEMVRKLEQVLRLEDMIKNNRKRIENKRNGVD